MSNNHKLLIIDESTLNAMSSNPSFVKEFPFLKNANKPAQKKDCRPCRQKASARIAAINTVKQSIVSMGAEKKKRLKTMLKADKVRIRVAQHGKVTEYTF